MSYILWFSNTETAHRLKDGRVVGSTERFSLFSRREAHRIMAEREKDGLKTSLRRADQAEIQHLRGIRTGSDWRPE